MQKLRLLFALLCCTLAGLAQTPDDIPKARTKPQWATLTDSVYAIHYPQNWSLDQSGMFGSSFFIYAPFDGPNDKFRENFNLIVDDLREFPGISLKELADGSRQQIINMISDVKILEFKEVTAENDTYYLLEYTGKPGQYNLHWKRDPGCLTTIFMC